MGTYFCSDGIYRCTHRQPISAMASLPSVPAAIATGCMIVSLSDFPKTMYFNMFGTDVPVSLKPFTVARCFTRALPEESIHSSGAPGASAWSPHFDAHPGNRNDVRHRNARNVWARFRVISFLSLLPGPSGCP